MLHKQSFPKISVVLHALILQHKAHYDLTITTWEYILFHYIIATLFFLYPWIIKQTLPILGLPLMDLAVHQDPSSRIMILKLLCCSAGYGCQGKLLEVVCWWQQPAELPPSHKCGGENDSWRFRLRNHWSWEQFDSGRGRFQWYRPRSPFPSWTCLLTLLMHIANIGPRRAIGSQTV